MTDILLTWLNTEVDLSKKVTDLERDFANGYLLGELLYKFNQLTNFGEFENREDRNSKIKNFTLLQEVLKNVQVKFGWNVARDIMEKKKGVILQLLYAVRSKLEKKGVNPENLSLKKSNHLSELYSSMKFRKEIPPFDNFNKSFFEQQLQSKIKAQKDVNMERHLSKFERFKKEQDYLKEEERKFEIYKQQIIVDERVKQMKSEGERFRSFQQQFEQKGIDDWKQNMLRRKEMEKKDLQFQLREAEKYQEMVYKSIKSSEVDAKRKIETFERNLTANAIKAMEMESTMDNGVLETSNSKKMFKSVMEFSNRLRDSITERILNDTNAKKERNRRRRKIIVEQSKAQLEIENRRREDQYIRKLYKQSNQEKQLTYETYRVMQIKNIIGENRRLRDEMYTERKEMDVKFLEKNEEEFLKFQREYFEMEMEKEEYRRKDLQIALRQKNRSNNTNNCKKMVELIVDIAEEAFIYQQTNDVEDIDPRVWKEWTQLFICNQSVKNKELLMNLEELIGENFSSTGFKNMDPSSTNRGRPASIRSNMTVNRKDSMDNVLSPHLMTNYNTKFGQTFYSAYTNEPNYSVIDKTLDDCEFIDYIHFIGQWSKGLIPESAFITINQSELMTDVPSQDSNKDNPTGKPGQVRKPATNAKDKNEDVYKEEDVDNLKIPNDILMNTYLGDLIDILVEMKYADEESQQTLRNFIFSHVPIKLSIIGHDFAGKKTQAKILSENYPFKIYIVDNLLKNALDILHKFENPVDAGRTTESKMMRTSQMEQIQKERAAEEAKYARIRELAMEIREILHNGEAVADHIYADLLVEFIKIDFPQKSDEEIMDEIFKRVNRKEEIQEELERNKEDKIKRPKAYNKLEQQLSQEMMQLSLEASKGFVIVNFPNTYNQAKVLERKLSAFVPEHEKPLSQATLLKESFGLILDRSAKIIPPRKLIEAGLDYIFWLDVDPKECIRRAIGRRTLPQISRRSEKEMKSSYQYDFEKKMEDRFSSQTSQNNETQEIYHLTDNPPATNSNICERLIKIDDQLNNESSLVTRHVSFENTIHSIIDFYEPFGFENEKIKMFQKVDGNRQKDFVTNDLIEHINKIVEINERREVELFKQEQEREHEEISGNLTKGGLEGIVGVISSSHQSNSNNIIDKTIENTSNNNLNNNVISVGNFDPAEEEENELTLYNKKIEKIKSTLNKDLAEVLLKIWSKIFENYMKDCKSIFKFLRLQRDSIGNIYNNICQKFIEFLKRPSKKQNLVLDFQLKYNKFMDDYPDLIDDPQVKEEHHQEVDDLNDKIYEIVESRKNEAIEERKKIMTAGWIENEMEKFYLNLERLYQAEIDKFIGSIQIIRDYYHNLDNRPLLELPFQTIDIIKEDVDPTPLESENDQNLFPRVEKLYKTALRVQFQYEEALIKAEKLRQEKLQEAAKKNKDPKQAAKKNVNPNENLDDKEIFAHEDEMKLALKYEKAKYRFRATLLKFWGIFCLQNIRKIANTVYNKLDDWIILAIKSENEALTQLTNIFKSKIEKEEKIKYELQLDTFDVIVNMDVQNFIVLPPKPHPAKEVIDHNKFNIKQLRIIIDELMMYQINSEYLRTSTFIEIFIKKYISSKNDNDVYYGLPTALKKLSFYNYYKFIRHLDPTCTDFLNIRFIGTYFSLLNAKIFTSDDEQSLRKEIEKHINLYEEERISKDLFVKTPMWFDNEEESPTLNMYENYNRIEKLKEIIFDINKDDEEMINIAELFKILNLKAINMDNDKYKNKTYCDVLFY